MPKSFYYQRINNELVSPNHSSSGYITDRIQDVNYEHEWLFLSLLPQMMKCGTHQNMDYPIVDCACNGDSGSLNENISSYTMDCLTDKMIFTANLMAIRIICDNIDNPMLTNYHHDKKKTEISDDLFHQIHEISSRSVIWCRESALEFHQKHESGLFWKTGKMQQNFLNVCLNWIQKCTMFHIDEESFDVGKKPVIYSQCGIDEELFEQISRKVFSIEKISRIKLLSSFGGAVGSGTFVILSIVMAGNPIVITTGVTFAVVNYIAEKYVNYLKLKNEGKWVKIQKSDLLDAALLVLGAVNGYVFSFGCIAKIVFDRLNMVKTVGEIPNLFKGAYQFRKIFKNLFKKKEGMRENEYDDVFYYYLYDTIWNNTNNLVKYKSTQSWQWKLNSETCLKTNIFGILNRKESQTLLKQYVSRKKENLSDNYIAFGNA